MTDYTNYNLNDVVIYDEQLKNMSTEELSCATAETLNILNGKKYCINDLEYIVKNTPTRIKTIVMTQILDYLFCRKYVLNPDYIIFDDDDMTIDEIIYYQPHLYNDFNKNLK